MLDKHGNLLIMEARRGACQLDGLGADRAARCSDSMRKDKLWREQRFTLVACVRLQNGKSGLRFHS